jgi:hypothetical protein
MDYTEKNKINSQILKKKAELRKWVVVKNYADIDIEKKPLYVSPENMLPGMGSLTPIEEFKGMIRMGWENFAKKIMSNDPEYKRIREEYEKETGKKIDSHEKAVELAKKHIGGTFDNAHMGAWLKHFKKLEGESEESRIVRFNNWMKHEAEDMAKEGIIRHVHFNDTLAKDDDHNLLGQGILDIHEMREVLRKRLGERGVNEAFIVEAGGRGAGEVLHLKNAFQLFNPSLFAESGGYGVKSESGSSVSDWCSVERDYRNRPQYSNYGMGYSAFRNVPSQNPEVKGSWSGTNFF